MARENQTILIVEDDEDLQNLMQINLKDQGYNTYGSLDGQDALATYNRVNPSLIILDLMLPKVDGLEVCKRIRAKDKSIPILMLTAKAEEVDKVLGLELGADDYMTKPFSIRELIARIKAILRRVDVHSNSNGKQQKTLNFHNLVINPDKRQVILNNELVELTSKEYDLLLLFSSNPGKAYSREKLLNQVWGYSYEGYSHTVNSHINRLRSKIETDPSDPTYIKTVWGVGYRFAEKDEIEDVA